MSSPAELESQVKAARKPSFCKRFCRQLNFYNLCRLKKVASLAACVLVAIVMIYAIIEYTKRPNGIDELEPAIELVAFIFYFASCVILFLALLEINLVLAQMKFLESWVGLGMALIYLAVLALAAVQPVQRLRRDNDLKIMNQTGGYAMAISGALFIVFGLIGGKTLKLKSKQAAEDAAKMDEMTTS